MRIYVELLEIAEIDEPDYVRVDVTRWESDDVDALIAMLDQYAIQNYEHYVLQYHFCFHDEEPEKPCSTSTVTSR